MMFDMELDGEEESNDIDVSKGYENTGLNHTFNEESGICQTSSHKVKLGSCPENGFHAGARENKSEPKSHPHSFFSRRDLSSDSGSLIARVKRSKSRLEKIEKPNDEERHSEPKDIPRSMLTDAIKNTQPIARSISAGTLLNPPKKSSEKKHTTEETDCSVVMPPPSFRTEWKGRYKNKVPI